MRIIVYKKPDTSSEYLFKKNYNKKCNHWNCGFTDSSVCFLDCAKECPYLLELGKKKGRENIKMRKWVKDCYYCKYMYCVEGSYCYRCQISGAGIDNSRLLGKNCPYFSFHSL